MSWEKKTRCLWLFDKLKRENTLTLEEYECLTSVKALELVYYAAEHAGEARKKVYGNEVYRLFRIRIRRFPHTIREPCCRRYICFLWLGS